MSSRRGKRYSTIKVDDETYARLLSLRLKAQSRLGRDLSLTETIRLLTELAEKPFATEVSQEEFDEAIEKFCPRMEDIEAEEAKELRNALGAIDGEN